MKDKELSKIYVKRCKCGERPYLDRISSIEAYWIKCNCQRCGLSATTKEKAIEYWNKDIFDYRLDIEIKERYVE